MIGFLVFYYVFSLLFQFGHGQQGEISGAKEWIPYLILLLITSPFMMPINLGHYIYKNE
jgi:hypothetical protein